MIIMYKKLSQTLHNWEKYLTLSDVPCRPSQPAAGAGPRIWQQNLTLFK